MEESRSPYETYILSQNIEYLPDYSIGEDDSGYEEDEVSASDLLKLETVFIFRCPEGYKAEQILESTGITLHNENWDYETRENLDISSDIVERYPSNPPAELLELSNLSLQEFSSNSDLTCWSIHWYVSGQFDVERDLMLFGWYLDFYLANNRQIPATEWQNFAWPESVFTKILSYSSATFTYYPFVFNKRDYFARIKKDSMLSKKVAPLHPDDVARLNCQALSHLLIPSSELTIDSLMTQLEKINSGATQGIVHLRADGS